MFRTWFPGLPLSRTASEKPALLVLCFPSAGTSEDTYTSEGTGVRRAPSPLLVGTWMGEGAPQDWEVCLLYTKKSPIT